MKPFSQAGADIAGRMDKMATALSKGNRDTVIAALKVAKREQDQAIRSDSGGDMKLSGVGKTKGRAGNAKVGSITKVHSDGNSGEIRATGPLQIINNDTQSRRIGSAWAGGTRARRSVAFGPVAASSSGGGRRAVLNTPFGFRRSVRHPGTKGKDTWQDGRRSAEPQVKRETLKRTTNILKRAM